MIGSRKNDIIFQIYKDKRSVFTLSDIGMLIGETNYNALNQRLFYYVKTQRLLRLRKGIYAKMDFNPLEVAGTVYTPCYISLEYVLQKAGVIFQYSSAITTISYLSRSIEIGEQSYVYRKIKSEILVNTKGVKQIDNINIATPERAVLDTIYLNGDTYFDNLNNIDTNLIKELLPIYQSKTVEIRTKKIFKL